MSRIYNRTKLNISDVTMHNDFFYFYSILCIKRNTHIRSGIKNKNNIEVITIHCLLGSFGHVFFMPETDLGEQIAARFRPDRILFGNLILTRPKQTEFFLTTKQPDWVSFRFELPCRSPQSAYLNCS